MMQDIDVNNQKGDCAIKKKKKNMSLNVIKYKILENILV